ncbi:MAG TPA: hypothetical protein VNI02_01820 [Blastocatellia bacterium]|jgi:hypothetical protein|nr:hypothetical protein [Blastocatellia bacterium]
MITGFNTDVRHEGRIYHVQTEDRGRENPILESLVYIGGTIVAKKSTPYSEQLSGGATEEVIASLLKRQHQVIIAAIKAGRIEDLIRHSAQKESVKIGPHINEPSVKEPPARAAQQDAAIRPASEPVKERVSAPLPVRPPAPPPATYQTNTTSQTNTISQTNGADSNNKPPAVKTSAGGQTGGLDLDQVIADYLKRNSEQGLLDLKVITPNVFIAGKNIGLRILVACNSKPDPDAVVTIKVIGTAFKPQVYIGRAGRDGVASFSLTLPAFTAGTAALVIEAQSGRGRGELKHLIRRA